MKENIKDILFGVTGIIVVSFVFAIPVYFLWNKVYMVFNFNQITYLQTVFLIVMINFMKPIRFSIKEKVYMKDSKICETCEHYGKDCEHDDGDDCAFSNHHNLDYCQYKPKKEDD